jgi:hypothetical protein
MAAEFEFPPRGIATGASWTKDLTDPVVGLGGTTYYKYKTTVAGVAYGAGQYVAWTNDHYTGGGENWIPPGAFDKIPGTSSARGWASAISLSTSTDSSTPPYVALMLPERIKLIRYTVQVRADTGNYQSPTAWTLYSSSDSGATFQSLHTISSQTGWAAGETRGFTIADAPADANAFKLEPLRVQTAGVVSIGEIAFFASPIPVLEYPPAGIASGGAWTRDASDVVPGIALGSSTYAKYKTTLAGAAYGNGQYVAWSNDIHGVGGADEWPASGAFDRLLAVSNSKSGWHVHVSSLVFTNIADAVEPPYVALALPERIQLARYVVQARNQSQADTQTPSAWIIFWSADGGATFQELHRIKGQTGWAPGEERSFSVPSAPAEANAFKFAVLRNNSATADWVSVGNVAFYGSPGGIGLRFPPLGYAPAGSAWTRDASASVASRTTGNVTNYKYSTVLGSPLGGTPVAAVMDVGPNTVLPQIAGAVVGSASMRAGQDPLDGSLYLPGVLGSYVSIPSTSPAYVADFSAQDFTVEAWVYYTATPPTSWGAIGNMNPGDSGIGWTLAITNGLLPTFYYKDANNNTTTVSGATATTLNAWHHLAATYTVTGTTVRVFLDGTLVKSVTKTGAGSAATSWFSVGQYSAQAGPSFYISNLRLVKGAALYTASFMPPSSPLIKTGGSGVTTLLLRTPLIPPAYALPVDKGIYNAPLTVTGTAVPSASMRPFASDATEGSMYFPGVLGSYLTIPTTSPAYVADWSAQDFTAEAWVYLTATPNTNNRLFGHMPPTGGGVSWMVNIDATMNPQFYYWNGAERYITSSSAVTLTTWNHIAVTFTLSTLAIRVYVNGVQTATAAKSGTADTGAYPFTVGQFNNTAGPQMYISNLRIVKGTAIYTAAFTPSTAPLKATANTVLLLKCPVVAPYGSGTYKVWSNTLAVGGEPAAAFDGTSSVPWNSAETAAYSASADVAVPAELVMSIPHAVRATSYTLTPPPLISDVSKTPTKWTLLGSFDGGVTFPYTLHTVQSTGTWTAGQARSFAITDSSVAVCNAYKWQFYRNGSAAATGLSLVQAAIFGVPSAASDAVPVPYPPLLNGPAWVRDDLDKTGGNSKYNGVVADASYGNGSYVAYASAESATLGPASWAFDARDGVASWTPGPTAIYTSSSDATNPATLTLNLPYRVKPASYVLRSRVDDVPEAAPSKWTLSASTDGGNTFVVLDTRSDLTAWAAGERRTYNITNPSGNDYNAVRWTFHRNSNNASAVVSYPTASLTGDEGMATASTTVLANSEPYLAFATGGDTDGWSTPSGLYTASTGTYAGTTVAIGAYGGEWLQIRLAKPVLASSYEIVASTIARGPKSFALLGSNDGGLTWTLVDAESNVAAYISGTAKTFAVSQATPTAFYMYRLVVSATQGDTTLSVRSLVIKGAVSMLCIADARLYAPASASAPSTTMATSAAVLEGVPGCLGWYRGDTWSGSQWRDASGTGNHLTSFKGAISTGTDPLKGFKFVRGGTDASVMLNPAILQGLPAYTIFNVAKYDGLSRKRILTSTGPTDGTRNGSWLSGFWAGHAGGVSYQGADAGWVAPPPGGVGGPPLFSFPPAPLTGATTVLTNTVLNGTYTVSASTSHDVEVGWRVFDATDAGVGWGWTPPLGKYTLAGTYTGTAMRALSNGSTYNGEWVQLQSPGAVVAHSYSIRVRGAVTARAPKAFLFLGSNEGAIWDVLDTQTVASGWTASVETVSFTLPAATGTAYKYFSLSVSAKAATSDNWLSIAEISITASLMPTPDAVATTIHGADEWIVSTDQKGSYRSNGTARVKTYSAAYPPASAQSLITSNSVTIANQLYGNGAYTFSASSVYTPANPAYPAYMAFNTSSGTDSEGWYANGPNYGDNGGAYTGTASTVAADATYAGEWLQVSLPYAIVLKSYLLTPRPGVFFTAQSPRVFVVFGSKTGADSSWVALDKHTVDAGTTVSNWTTDSKTFVISPAVSEAYSFYRISIQVIGNTSTTGTNYASLNAWTLYETDQPAVTFPSTAAQALIFANQPTSAFTGLAYGNGYYAFTASSEAGAGFEAWRAFNASSGSRWAAAGYTATTGAYAGTTSTTLADGFTMFAGEWVQASFPIPFFMQSYAVTPSGDLAKSPRSFALLGSVDGVAWYALDSRADLGDWTADTAKPAFVPTAGTSPVPYSYYRLVVRAIGNTGQPNWRDYANVKLLVLTGVQTANASLTPTIAPFTYRPVGGQIPSAAVQALANANTITVAAATNTINDNGTWVFSGSSRYQGDMYPAFIAFNNNLNDWWHAESQLYNGAGAYTGSTSTAVSGSTAVLGDWLQVKMPLAVSYLMSYTIAPRIEIPSRSPKDFKVLGSNDGTTWFLLDSRSGITWSTTPQTFTLSSPTVTGYAYYRLVTTSVVGSDSVQIASWYFTQATAIGDQYPSTAIQALVTANSQPISTQAYGNGTWVFSASSEPYPSGLAFHAFNTSNLSYWHGSNTYSSTNGAYLGSTFTTSLADASTTAGEWLQVQMPTAMFGIASYTIEPRQDGLLYLYRSPNTFKVLGSNDGTAWYLVDSRSGINDWTAAAKTFVLPMPTTTPYSYYRIVISTIGNTGNANSTYAQIATLFFTLSFALPYPSAAIRALATSNTPAAVTGKAYGNGNWAYSASSTHSTYPACQAFDSSSADSSIWHSDYLTTSRAYVGTTGEYNTLAGRTASTTLDGAAYYGEWLQVQMPAPIFPQAYTVTPRQESTWPFRSPRNFVLLGSPDGVGWVLLDARTGNNTWTAAAKTFTLTTATSPVAVPYSYFRLVTQAVNNDGSANSISVNISSFEIAAVPVSPTTLAPTTVAYPLSVNGFATEASDWAMAEMLIFGRHLSGPEVMRVEDYLTRRYLGAATVGTSVATSGSTSVPSSPVSFSSLATSAGSFQKPYSMAAIRTKMRILSLASSARSSKKAVPSTGAVGMSTMQEVASPRLGPRELPAGRVLLEHRLGHGVRSHGVYLV